jgi:hypothetical protein
MKLKTLPAALLYSLTLLSFSAVFIGTVVDVSWANHTYGSGMSEFRRFLYNHPGIARDLERNPDLIRNRRYLDRHDDLREFLRDHPNVAREYLSRSYPVRSRYDRWDNNRGWGWGYRR